MKQMTCSVRRLAFENLTKRIVGAAMEVPRTLGPGFSESIYEGMNTPVVPVFYEHVEVGDRVEERTSIMACF